MNKRRWLLIMLFAMVAALLVACGGDETESD